MHPCHPYSTLLILTMPLRIYKFFFFLFLIKNCWADTFNIDLMFFYQTQSVYRGAQIWPKGSVMAAPGFLFFDRKLKIYGPNISYTLFPEADSQFKMDLGARLFNDGDPLFSLGKAQLDHKNRRKKSLETYANFRYQFGFKNKFFINLYLGREVIEHLGLYSQLGIGAPLFPFTSLVGKISFAEKKTNQYLYGPEGVSGTGFGSIGINLVFPFVPWDGIIVNQLTHSWVLIKENQSADYIRSDTRQLTFSTRWIWKIF